jgi:hypothetical protein
LARGFQLAAQLLGRRQDDALFLGAGGANGAWIGAPMARIKHDEREGRARSRRLPMRNRHCTEPSQAGQKKSSVEPLHAAATPTAADP